MAPQGSTSASSGSSSSSGSSTVPTFPSSSEVKLTAQAGQRPISLSEARAQELHDRWLATLDRSVAQAGQAQYEAHKQRYKDRSEDAAAFAKGRLVDVAGPQAQAWWSPAYLQAAAQGRAEQKRRGRQDASMQLRSNRISQIYDAAAGDDEVRRAVAERVRAALGGAADTQSTPAEAQAAQARNKNTAVVVRGFENPDAPQTGFPGLPGETPGRGYPGGQPNGPIYRNPSSGGGTDETLALILPLLVLLTTLIVLLVTFVILVIFVRRRARIALLDGDGPLDVGREEELEGLGGLNGVEERWLETVDASTRRGYNRAKDWQLSNPPGSLSTDITLSQFLSIQEKGVSAWSFDPDYESNPSTFVEARTEITFVADGAGMAPEEGGGCCVQSNLPLPKLNEVYYWEAKIFTKPEGTNVALGLATKPYPSFRLPGIAKYSVGYFSADGFKAHNYPFTSQSYGPAYVQGDVIGVGYRPRTGTVFFTRNGKKHEDAFVGLNRYNLFPTVGADGAAEIHVNLGQAGFVFIEANVKKWGLAPMVGTLAPPPAYGVERGSFLIETGTSSGRVGGIPRGGEMTPPPPLTPTEEETMERGHGESAPQRRAEGHSSMRGGRERSGMRLPSAVEEGRGGVSPPRRGSASSENAPHNPPTPNALDISLHSLPPHQLAAGGPDSAPGGSPTASTGLLASYFPSGATGSSSSSGSSHHYGSNPPPYAQGSWTSSHGSRPRPASRAHSIASSVLGALADRGLLTPLSSQSSRGARTPDEVDASTARNTDANRSAARTDTWLASWFR